MAAGRDPFAYSKALVLGANSPPFHHNFGFDNNQVQVSVYGVGGRTVRKIEVLIWVLLTASGQKLW